MTEALQLLLDATDKAISDLESLAEFLREPMYHTGTALCVENIERELRHARNEALAMEEE